MDMWIGIGVVIVAVVLLLLFLASRYMTPKVNEAIIVSGSGKKDREGNDSGGTKVLTGSGGFVMPIIQRAVSISLNAHKITTACQAISNDKIKVNLNVVAIFKVGSTDEAIRAAAQRFSGKESEIDNQVQPVLEGAMRAIVGRLSVEELLTDRLKFAEELKEEINSSISAQGLDLDTLQIQEISDENGYIDNLGRPQEAAVQQAAEIAQANAMQNSKQAQIEAQKKVALANKDLALQQATINEETSKRQAEADAAGPIAKAEQEKSIVAAQQKIELAQVDVQKAKLQGTVNAQADADKYKRQVDAEADANARQEAARGNAEALKLQAAAEAEATLTRAKAEAEAARLKAEANAIAITKEGEATAEALKAKGVAEAESMKAKADSYDKYGQAAIIDAVLAALPSIAGEIAKPLAGAKITAVNADASDQTASLVTDIAAKAPEYINSFTGLDIADSIRKMAGGRIIAETPADKPVIEVPEVKAEPKASQED
jgi:flotillin